jgi:iron-sulfur cluster assembly protein
MIHISDLAVTKAIELMKEEGLNPSSHFIRLGAHEGGCHGYKYLFKFDEQKNENDQVFDHVQVKIVVDKESLEVLSGTKIDFEGGVNGSGFFFENPVATGTCGCGDSFSA